MDIRGAFLQSCHELHEVYVLPRCECSDRCFCGLLEVAACGLDNANSKWQKRSDETNLKVGLQSVGFSLKLFDLMQDQKFPLNFAKAIDDILVDGSFNLAHDLVHRLWQYHTLG